MRQIVLLSAAWLHVLVLAAIGTALSPPGAHAAQAQDANAPRASSQSVVPRAVTGARRPTEALRGARPGLARKPAGDAAEREAPASQVTGERAIRTTLPVSISTEVGGAGFVHFFLIESPRDEPEIQVGIELPDGRIAWSFPGLGVVVYPFITSGTVAVNETNFTVQHLYGIRPFPDDAVMRAFEQELLRRIIPWTEDNTPYCFLPGRPDYFCVSCLGFVMRVLFPGRSPAVAAVPRDFERTNFEYYTTEDLLLYLLGLHGLGSHEARLKRLNTLKLPENLHAEATRLVNILNDIATADAARHAMPRDSHVAQ